MADNLKIAVLRKIARKIRSRIRYFRLQRERAHLDLCTEEAMVSATPKPELWPPKIREIRVLACCGRGLYLLDSLQVWKLACGRHFGLTKYQGYYYVFHTHNKNEGSIYRFVLDGKRIRDCKRLFSDLSGGVHQIDFIDENLFITDAYRNEIVILDPDGRLLKRIYPLGKLTDGRQSPNYGHLNSIYARDDNVYVVAHNETYKTGKKSEILVLQRADHSITNVIPEVGSCAHNVVARDGLFLVCDSLKGSLKNHNEDVFEPSTFTRGLAVSDEFIIVGGSVYSERGKRLDNDVFVYVLTRDFELVGTLKIKDAGQINEIRLLDKDYGLSNASTRGKLL